MRYTPPWRIGGGWGKGGKDTLVGENGHWGWENKRQFARTYIINCNGFFFIVYEDYKVVNLPINLGCHEHKTALTNPPPPQVRHG